MTLPYVLVLPANNRFVAIAVPMGMGCKEDGSSSVAQPADVVDALADAEKFFWEHLSITASNGSIIKIRDAAISLALVGAFRTSLGDKRTNVSTIMASLLGRLFESLDKF